MPNKVPSMPNKTNTPDKYAGKLGAGNSGGQVCAADLWVFRGLLAPFVDLLLPLEALACLMFAQALGKGVGLLICLGGIFCASGSLL